MKHDKLLNRDKCETIS